MLTDADRDLVQPVFNSFVDQTSLFQYNGGARLQMKTDWLKKAGTTVSEEDQRLLTGKKQSDNWDLKNSLRSKTGSDNFFMSSGRQTSSAGGTFFGTQVDKRESSLNW